MKFTVLQENLAKAISLASRFTSTRAQLPVLGNILIKAQKTKVFISSTNLEISVSTEIGAKVEKEGEISIPSRVLTEIVSNLPKETINLEAEKEQLKIATPSFSSKILGMSAVDFPNIPSSFNKADSLAFAKKDLVDALSKVIFAVSLDETRPVLTGVLFIMDKKNLSLVATDGFRLSRKKLAIEKSGQEERVIIPRGVLGEVVRSMSEEGDEAFFSVRQKDKQAVFGMEGVVLTSRLLEGEYPDFEKILPKSSQIKVLLDKEDLLRAVKLASVFARDAANIVKIKILSDSVIVSAESSASGSQETKVEAKVEGGGKDFEIAFNFRFLEEFLHSVPGEEIKMEFSNADAPGVFTDPTDSSYLHLIMPVKIQG